VDIKQRLSLQRETPKKENLPMQFHYRVTVSAADVVWLKLPLTPLIVSVYVFRVAVDSVFTVSVEVPVVGFGVNVTVEPEGCPVRLNVTDPVNPFTLLTVTE
jgi:hypothetical protein